MYQDRQGPLIAWMPALAFVALGAASCEAVTDPSSGVTLEALTETALTGVEGNEVLPVPVVRVVDDGGSPVGGVQVRFSVKAGRGVVEAPWAISSADGLASASRWIVTEAGMQTLSARVGESRVDFFVDAERWRGIMPVAGDRQAGGAGEALPEHLRVSVTETEDGWPLPGAEVTFTVVSGGGTIENGSAVTDSDGLADAGAWTLGPEVGTQQVRAESGSAWVVFIAYATQPF